MRFLPELNSKGEIATKEKKQKRVITFDWSNLQVGRCPMCGNYLKEEKAGFVCDGKDHERPFRIKEKKMQLLKKKMLFSNERREQQAHLRSIE